MTPPDVERKQVPVPKWLRRIAKALDAVMSSEDDAPDVVERLSATITDRVLSEDGAHYIVTFRENGGASRIFKQKYARYDGSGMSLPRPYVNDKVNLSVNSLGEVVYGGSALLG